MGHSESLKAKFRERYGILVGLGCTPSEARAGSTSIRRFQEAMSAKGYQPPADIAHLTQRELGGWPRVDTPYAKVRKGRYWQLRARGLTAAQASYGSGSDGRYTRTLRLLDAGLPCPE